MTTMRRIPDNIVRRQIDKPIVVYPPKKVGDKWVGAVRIRTAQGDLQIAVGADEPLMREIYRLASQHIGLYQGGDSVGYERYGQEAKKAHNSAKILAPFIPNFTITTQLYERLLDARNRDPVLAAKDLEALKGLKMIRQCAIDPDACMKTVAHPVLRKRFKIGIALAYSRAKKYGAAGLPQGNYAALSMQALKSSRPLATFLAGLLLRG